MTLEPNYGYFLCSKWFNILLMKLMRGGSGMSQTRRTLTYHQKTYTFPEFSRLMKIPTSTLYSRWDRGYREDDLVSKTKFKSPATKAKKIIVCGEETTLNDLALSTGIAKSTLRHRWENGDRDEELLREPNLSNLRSANVYVIDIGGQRIRRYQFLNKYGLPGWVMGTLIREKHMTASEVLEYMHKKIDTHAFIEYQGHHFTAREFARHFNLDPDVVRARWKQGLRGDDLSRP